MSETVERRNGMTVQSAEICRITVVGPRGRADLAVPLSVPVVTLLPILLRHTGESPAPGDEPAPWVLQRLAGAPFDPAGTPETLDWREGEEFYLRPGGAALPELLFDDVADGLATMVTRRPGRWRPEFNRWLFLGFSIAALLLAAWIVLHPSAGTGFLPLISAGVAALALLTGAIMAGGRTRDAVLVQVLGLGGCGFAALAGGIAAAGVPGTLDLSSAAVLAGAVTTLIAAAVLLVARAVWASAIPFATFGAVLAAAVLALVAEWLYLGLQLAQTQVAGVLSVVLVVLLTVAPRIAIRLARVRGPQLPWNADDLQVDIDPVAAREMQARTAVADDCVTIAALSAAVAIAAAQPFLVFGGLFETVVGVLVATAVLLRARAFRGAWQRVPLAAAGGLGLALAAFAVITSFETTGQAVALLVVAGVFVALLHAVVRPPARRLLPIWGHVANGLETVSAIAVVPALLQLFGVYAWASGIFG